MSLDLTLLSLYRINGQEIAYLPGLLAVTPPEGTLPIRRKDRLLVYLLLTGNVTISMSEYKIMAVEAANIFYRTGDSLNSALRVAAESVNKKIIERNASVSEYGQYLNGLLTLAAFHDSQCAVLISGPMHVYHFKQNELRHIYDPATSGKGLGITANINFCFSQISLQEDDFLLFCGIVPTAWMLSMPHEPALFSLYALRRFLNSVTSEDLNSALLQATDGVGAFEILNPNDDEIVYSSGSPLRSADLTVDNFDVDETLSSSQSQQLLRVFLCHASADKSIVRDLHERLKSEGWIDSWLDEEKLALGQHWAEAIESALDDADIVIIFLSNNSVKKEGFVQRELNYAWEISLEKPRNVIFLIPFRLDDCEVPRHLRARQWGDYFGDKKESTYQTLLRSLKERYQQKIQSDAE